MLEQRITICGLSMKGPSASDQVWCGFYSLEFSRSDGGNPTQFSLLSWELWIMVAEEKAGLVLLCKKPAVQICLRSSGPQSESVIWGFDVDKLTLPKYKPLYLQLSGNGSPRHPQLSHPKPLPYLILAGMGWGQKLVESLMDKLLSNKKTSQSFSTGFWDGWWEKIPVLLQVSMEPMNLYCRKQPECGWILFRYVDLFCLSFRLFLSFLQKSNLIGHCLRGGMPQDRVKSFWLPYY